MRCVDVQPWVMLAATVAAIGCGANAQTPPKPASAAGGRAPVAVTVARAAVRDMTDAVDVVGSLAPKFFADVKSEVTGVVTAVYVTEWAAVRAGDPLARLDASETEAAIAALKAAAAQAAVA